jgi:LPXTG-motif cell wall-anchored protein
MRTLISALAAAGLLLAAAPVATADDETTTTTTTTTSTTPTTTPTTTTTTEEPTETPTSTTAELLGPNDQRLIDLTFKPDKKTYRPGDTFTATMTVGNDALNDSWAIEGSFPAGLTVTGSTGMVDVVSGTGTFKGRGEDRLDPVETATPTVTFRADAETSGQVTFRLLGGQWPDPNPNNNTVTRAVVVSAAAPVPPKPAPQPAPKPAPQPELAETGASAMVPLFAGGVLVLLGGGLLVAVRRRNT